MSTFARRLQQATVDYHAASAPAIKHNYGGLFVSTESNRTSWSPPLDHYWLKVNWSDLEPQQGQYDFSSITTYLNAHPGVNVRLHVQGGDNAPVGTSSNPGWLANIAGGGVNVTNTRAGTTAFCGRYWVQAYKDAYAALVTALGAAFDSNQQIASINNAGCSLIFDEPWIMGGDSASTINLYNSGLTKATQQSAIYDALAALMVAFPTTVVEMATHSELTYPTASGQGGSWTEGRDQLNTLDALYGDHIIITDYGLGPGEDEAAQPLDTATTQYSWMHGRAVAGRPIAFQATLAAAGSPDTSANQTGGCDAAVAMKARWYEHNAWALLTNSQVQTYDAEFKANVV